LHRLGWREQQSEGFEEKTRNVANTCFKPIDHQPNSWGNNETNRNKGKRTRFADGGCGKTNVSNTTSIRPSGQGQSEQSVNSAQNGNRKAGQSINVRKSSFWAAEPDVGRVADGVAARVDRLKAIGNGQVSEVARRAWEILGDKG
jgi:DNA (cytosine-5)-methyltransferase 1